MRSFRFAIYVLLLLSPATFAEGAGEIPRMPSPNASNFCFQAGDVPIDPLCQAIIPVAYKRKVDFHEARNLTGNALLAVSFGLRAYYLDNSRYPAKLDDLVPQYVRAVPVDPFGKGEPLHYKATTNTYLLYSIGPDGRHDGGRRIEDKTRPGTQKHAIALTSKGDFVAGINY